MTEKLRRCDRVIVGQQQCEDSCQSVRFFFDKLGFQGKIFSKETILFIPSKVLGDFKANKAK